MSRDQFAGFLDQAPVLYEVAELEIRKATLRLAKQLAGAALAQVFLSQLKAVAAFFHHGQPVLPLLGSILSNEYAKRLVRASTDAPPELVQLRQPKSIGIFDQHDRGVGDIHAHLDHAGG